MCGIVGFIGNNSAVNAVLDGLEKLEYRGYDSAGIALISDDIEKKENIEIYKDKGRIEHLKEILNNSKKSIESNICIGHTRWATHGKPNKENAHPHKSESSRFSLVHNGIIENYEELKDRYLNQVKMKSDTDSEVLVQLLEIFSNNGETTIESIRHIMTEVRGSYALAIIDKEDSDIVYAAKNKSPLLVGQGSDFNMLASDALAMIRYTNDFYELEDEEYLEITKSKVKIFDLNGIEKVRKSIKIDIDMDDIEKGIHDHYMIKEIKEQPCVIRKIIEKYSKNNQINIDDNLIEEIRKSDRIYIVACGTSYHASLVGKEMLEKISKKPAEVLIASEFVYGEKMISEKAIFVFLSQSGETADCRAALVKIKNMGYKSITITNTPKSTLDRESDYSLLLHAGPEISVASTKAYTAQLAVFSLLASKINNSIDIDILYELSIVSKVMEDLCDQEFKYEKIAENLLFNKTSCFYIGRNLDYFTCLEASLKLKEISYIHTEGFAAGELKHGPIALIEEGTPVIAIITQSEINSNTRANINEVRARGANVVIISLEKTRQDFDDIIIGNVHNLLSPMVSSIPTQFIAYYAAKKRGYDIDKPRNLAKSVTVE